MTEEHQHHIQYVSDASLTIYWHGNSCYEISWSSSNSHWNYKLPLTYLSLMMKANTMTPSQWLQEDKDITVKAFKHTTDPVYSCVSAVTAQHRLSHNELILLCATRDNIPVLHSEREQIYVLIQEICHNNTQQENNEHLFSRGKSENRNVQQILNSVIYTKVNRKSSFMQVFTIQGVTIHAMQRQQVNRECLCMQPQQEVDTRVWVWARHRTPLPAGSCFITTNISVMSCIFTHLYLPELGYKHMCSAGY